MLGGMSIINRGALTTVLALAAAGRPASLSAAPPAAADLVLRNARIVTMDPARPTADALAVRGDTILAVGSWSEVEPYVRDGTEVLDLAGRLAVPGFIEA